MKNFKLSRGLMALIALALCAGLFACAGFGGGGYYSLKKIGKSTTADR